MNEPKPADSETNAKRSLGEAKRNLKRLAEARRVIEDYANDLRKIMDQLRQKMNN